MRCLQRYVAGGSKEEAMKTSRKVVVGVALALAAGMVQADRGGRHGGHWHGPRVGVVIGAPFGWYGPPFWYGPPYWYEPPMVVQSPPPVYIERGADVAGEGPEPYYWYHCSKPEGYYPYVKDCPGGWKKVVPTPPSN